MEIRDVVRMLRREKGLSEAKAGEQAHAMLAFVRGKHPRLKIVAVTVSGETTTICLANGIQAEFDPASPVPIWKYPEGMHRKHPKKFRSAYANVLAELEYLQFLISRPSTEEERRSAQERIDEILRQRHAQSVEELEQRISKALEAESRS